MPSVATTEPPAGIVLAGGASRRMGRDKACLTLGGDSLLERAVRTLRAAGAAPVLVSGDRPGHDSVPDQIPGRGPLGGLASVLAARAELQGRLLLLMAVDTPAIQPAALERLVQASLAGPGAHYQDHPLPLAVRATAALSETLTALLRPGEKAAVQRLARELRLHQLPAVDVDLSNINTPQDYAALRPEPT